MDRSCDWIRGNSSNVSSMKFILWVSCVSSIVFFFKVALPFEKTHPLATPIVLFMFPIQDRTGKVCFGANVNWM